MKMKKLYLSLVTLVVAIALSACSSSTASPTNTAPPPKEEATDTVVSPKSEPTPTKPGPTPTEAEPMDLPDTPVSAKLGVEPDTTYKVTLRNFQRVSFDESELPAAPGSVTAQWYTAGDRYAVAYVGIDVSEGTPLCPGNSILTNTGFLHVSNAPTVEGACEGFPTLTTDPDIGPVVCQDTLVYVTAIPSDQQGMLFGTLEALSSDGAIVGLTSAVQSTSDMPELNLEELCK